jgi:hypothetical protein
MERRLFLSQGGVYLRREPVPSAISDGAPARPPPTPAWQMATQHNRIQALWTMCDRSGMRVASIFSSCSSSEAIGRS